jgi:uncharacterized membrane protein YccC
MLSLAPTLYAPSPLALGWLVGGLLAGLVTSFRPAVSAVADDDPLPSIPAEPLVRFALVRTLAVLASTVIGWYAVSSHPFWITLPVLIILAPDRERSVVAAAQNTLGALIGAFIGIGIVAITPKPETLLLTWLLSLQVLLSVRRVNVTLYTTVLTLVLVIFYALIEADVVSAGIDRVTATVIGAALALAALAVMAGLERASAKLALRPDPMPPTHD